MRKNLKPYIAGLLTAFLLCGFIGVATANTGKVMQELEYRDIRVSLDGKVLDLRNAIGEKVEPFMFGGTNYLPVRALAEALGLNVSWDGKEVMVVLTTPEPSPSPSPTPAPVSKDTYAMGETWTVPGQWSLTVTGVTKTGDRNQFSDLNPAAVYIVDYTYTNLGWTSDYLEGIFFSMDDTIVDSAGDMGYSYPGNKTLYAQETPVGATCKAQSVIGVDNAGTFKVSVSKYDTNDKKQTATFVINAD